MATERPFSRSLLFLQVMRFSASVAVLSLPEHIVFSPTPPSSSLINLAFALPGKDLSSALAGLLC